MAAGSCPRLGAFGWNMVLLISLPGCSSRLWRENTAFLFWANVGYSSPGLVLSTVWLIKRSAAGILRTLWQPRSGERTGTERRRGGARRCLRWRRSPLPSRLMPLTGAGRLCGRRGTPYARLAPRRCLSRAAPYAHTHYILD